MPGIPRRGTSWYMFDAPDIKHYPGKRNAITVAIILAASAALAYHNSMNSPFVFDDIHYIERNPLIRDLGKPWQVVSFNPARAFLLFTFAVNWAISGHQTWSYHLVNLSIHWANAFMVYLLAAFLLKRKKDSAARMSRYLDLAPLLSSMVFLLHPIQTEAVTYIVGRSSSLAALFYLAAMLIFVHASTAEGRRAPWSALLVVLYLLAMAAKEIAATLPATMFLMDILFLDREGRRRRAFSLHLPLWIVLWLLVVARLTLLGSIGNPEKGGLPPPLVYFMTQLAVFPRYLKLLLWPAGLSIDHDMPWRTSLLHFDVVLGAALAVAALGSTYLWRRNSFLVFGLLFFGLTLAPTSSFLPIRDPMVERRLYLPLVGPAVLFGTLVSRVCSFLEQRFSKTRHGVLVAVASFGVCIVLANLTITRNADYSSRLALWTATMRTSPGKARVYNNLGLAYMDAGDLFSAEELFRQAIRMDPENAKAYNNLGVLKALLGKYDQAESLLSKAEQLAVDYPDPIKNHALLAAYTGRCGTAEKLLAKYEEKKIPPGPDQDGRKRIAVCVPGKVLEPKDLKFE